MSPASPGCSRLVEFNCHPELVEGSRFSRLRWLARKATGFFNSVPLRFTSLRMTRVVVRAPGSYRYVQHMNALNKSFTLALFVALVTAMRAADYPPPTEGDYVIRDFKFTSGELMPELKIHYRTIGKTVKDEKGVVRNAVLITHGTTGSGAQFIRPEFAGELFGAGQPLDAAKFFIVLPDGIGHGKSSKPSDRMHAKFPRYGYVDMVEAQFRLLTDGLG